MPASSIPLANGEENWYQDIRTWEGEQDNLERGKPNVVPSGEVEK